MTKKTHFQPNKCRNIKKKKTNPPQWYRRALSSNCPAPSSSFQFVSRSLVCFSTSFARGH